jgi:hypothetical protein
MDDAIKGTPFGHHRQRNERRAGFFGDGGKVDASICRQQPRSRHQTRASVERMMNCRVAPWVSRTTS